MAPYRSVGVVGDDPFRNNVRRELFEIIRGNHKITQKELQQASGIRSRSSVTHHLRILEELGYVTCCRTGRENVYKPTYSQILAGRPINHGYKQAIEDLSVY